MAENKNAALLIFAMVSRRYTALSKMREIAATVKLSTLAILRTKRALQELGEMLLASFEKHPLRHHFPPFAGFRVVESSSYYGKGYQDV